MPARDIYHAAVKNALVKDGWTITHDPLIVPYGETNVFVDLGAEAPLAAQKGERRIAVEVKSFRGPSEVADLEQALGQYELYLFLLAREEPERTLYLAVTVNAYSSVFDTAVGRDLVAAKNLRIVVVEPFAEVVVRWIP